jgi:predicted DNA-binding transcriptional regulator AlpA
MTRTNNDRSTQWDQLPDLLLLPEVIAITRHSLKGAYNKLAAAEFPIAHVPHAKPYRFHKSRVRAWVEEGVISNENLLRRLRRRGPGRKFFQAAEV